MFYQITTCRKECQVEKRTNIYETKRNRKKMKGKEKGQILRPNTYFRNAMAS